jgi:pimeloyl-ACP methyl ester carboxylesterase
MTTLERLSSICAHWSEPGPSPLIPVGTTVPTLVLVGQFDPVAGPELSHKIATAIGTNARLVEFPRLGHNVRHFSPCAATIVARFIEQPTEALDTSCANRRPPIQFLAKSQAP